MKKIASIAFIISLFLSGVVNSEERCYGLYTGDNPTTEVLTKDSALYSSTPCAVLLFYDATWTPSFEQLEIIGESGAIPIITIEPWDASTKEPRELSDEYIKELAGAINRFGEEVYIRFAHEMNGNWYPWGGSPEKYKELYISFYDRLSQHLTGNNVKWVWSVNNFGEVNEYYPGDRYVDMIGLDGYLKNPSFFLRLYLRGKNVFEYLFGGQIKALKAFNKPFIITETAIASMDDFKARMIRELFEGMEKRYPDINMIVWFDVNKEADWRIASGIKSLEFFKKGLKDWTTYEKERPARTDTDGK